MKFYFSICLVLVHSFAFSQENLHKISLNDLPKNLQNTDNIAVAMRWTDSLGDNILVITKKTIKHIERLRSPFAGNGRFGHGTTRLQEKDPQRAFHYIIINDSAIGTWEVIGLPRLCDENISFTKNSFVITDLDSSHKAEVWLIYKNECPDNSNQMKIVMFEDDIKYSATGEFKQPFLKSNFDQNFLSFGQRFQNYCVQLWKKFSIEQQ